MERKKHIRAKLIEITEWRKDQQRIAGDISHEGESNVLVSLADEVKTKLEECTFDPPYLPFEYDFDMEPEDESGIITEDQVKDYVLDEYITQFMPYDYVIPVDCEIEWNKLEVLGL